MPGSSSSVYLMKTATILNVFHSVAQLHTRCDWRNIPGPRQLSIFVHHRITLWKSSLLLLTNITPVKISSTPKQTPFLQPNSSSPSLHLLHPCQISPLWQPAPVLKSVRSRPLTMAEWLQRTWEDVQSSRNLSHLSHSRFAQHPSEETAKKLQEIANSAVMWLAKTIPNFCCYA